MLNGTVVQSILIGGPAFNSSQLDTGDVVIGVDGCKVSEDNIASHLTGNDTAGSTVTLTVQKQRDHVGFI